MERLLALQDGVCPICGVELVILGPGPNTACVDHRHDPTKKVRGLLCSNCNAAIGLLKDDPSLCEKAAKYLRESSHRYTPKQEWRQGFPIDERHAIMHALLERLGTFRLSDYLEATGGRVSRRQASRDLAEAPFLVSEGNTKACRYHVSPTDSA
jgi:hypothetical protein